MTLNDNGGVGVELEYVNVEVISRLELLYLSMSEFASAFGADKDCINSIKKGVEERQIIEEVMLYYYDQNDKVQGFISLKIDWDKYEVNIKDYNNRTFKVDTSKPLLKQLDQSIEEIINHVNRMRKNLKIKKITTRYTYRSIYRNNDEKYRDALKYLNHVIGEGINVPKNDEFDRSMKVCLSKLDELEISIYSKK